MQKSNIRVALVGSTGWLGSKLYKVLDEACHVTAFRHFELFDLDHNPYYFNVIVNAAGKIGSPNVAAVQGKIEELRAGNVDLPKKLAEIAKKGRCHLIHISSGCLYTGYKETTNPLDPMIFYTEGWTEEDEPNFDGSDYVISKRNGELAISDYEKVTIIRPRMPFNSDPTDKNLLLKLAKYSKSTLVDSINTITPVELLNESIYNTVLNTGNKQFYGTFNLCSLSPTSTSMLVEHMQEELNLNFGMEYQNPDAFNEQNETKRSFTSISSKKSIATGIINFDDRSRDPHYYVGKAMYELRKIPAKKHLWLKYINS